VYSTSCNETIIVYVTICTAWDTVTRMMYDIVCNVDYPSNFALYLYIYIIMRYMYGHNYYDTNENYKGYILIVFFFPDSDCSYLTDLKKSIMFRNTSTMVTTVIRFRNEVSHNMHGYYHFAIIVNNEGKPA
jgi:hypothetical protein